MTNHPILFALAYQVPALVLGFVLKALLVHPALKAIFVLPGTFVHELLHLLVGLILNAKPVSVSLMPRKVGPGRWILGAVGFSNIRWYNAVFVGVAPLLAIVVAMLFAPEANGWTLHRADILHWICTAPVLVMCWPSSTDLRIALKSWSLMGLAIGLIAWYLRRP